MNRILSAIVAFVLIVFYSFSAQAGEAYQIDIDETTYMLEIIPGVTTGEDAGTVIITYSPQYFGPGIKLAETTYYADNADIYRGLHIRGLGFLLVPPIQVWNGNCEGCFIPGDEAILYPESTMIFSRTRW